MTALRQAGRQEMTLLPIWDSNAQSSLGTPVRMLKLAFPICERVKT